MDEFAPFTPSLMKELFLEEILNGLDVVIGDLFPLLYLLCINNLKLLIN